MNALQEASRYTTQSDLDRGETRIPRFLPGERLIWGAEDARPLRISWRHIGDGLLAVGALLASASTGFLLGVALGVIWQAVTR